MSYRVEQNRSLKDVTVREDKLKEKEVLLLVLQVRGGGSIRPLGLETTDL